MTITFAYITTPTRELAETLGRLLVQERLAACVNIFDGMTSFYWWDGVIEEGRETVLIAKTDKAHFPALVDRVIGLHPYDNPCVIELKTGDGNPAYLNWLKGELDHRPTS